MRWTLILFAAALLLAATTAARAQNQYYVAATGGSDANSGTSLGSPWATCNHAVASATLNSVGATINFIASPSNHAACSAIARNVASPARLALVCTQPWSAGTHCKMSGAFIITTANNIDIGALPQLGFEYTNTSDNTGIDGVTPCAADSGACASGNGIHILGNYLHDIATGCPSSGAIIMPNRHGVSVTDIQVIGNVIDHFATYPQSGCSVSQGIYIASQGGQIYNNIVTRSAYSGLQYYDQGCTARISNNIFANNNMGMVLYGSHGCTPGLNTVDNNIIVNNVTGPINNSFTGDQGCSTGRQTLYSNNLLFGNGNNNLPTSSFGSCTTTQNQKTENPTTTFVNYTGTAAGDYHLKAGSIAIAGGISQCTTNGPTPCIPSKDFSNASRPLTGAQDIGVYLASSAGTPSVSFSPSPLAFGTVAVSVASSLTAILANNGNANLTFSVATIAGTNAADYTVTSTNCSSPLLQQTSCTYTIRFIPSATGSRTASLTLNDNAPGSPHQLPLTGTGGTGVGSLTPNPASFGVVAPGACSAPQAILLTNTGTVSFNINASSTITPSTIDFQGASPIGSCAIGPLAPGASCTTNVKFCPASAGAKTATFTAFTDANDPTSTLNGTGGAPVVSVTPSSGNCGSVQVGTSVNCQVFILTNTGNLDLTNVVVSIP